ncbi:hypothetical protein T07_10808 [Trichinella nelsoni]|uniref:Uncharacterized protein n=1 Tax=Trichinella nelsoni TaxID=6336 RepID=A0A0V0SJL8_9BILA|nr:hypothetical protein T07_10808 [Trichinella nelsoni]
MENTFDTSATRLEEAEKSLRRRNDHETSIQQPAYAQFYNKNVTRLRPTASLANSPQATRLAYFHRITTENATNYKLSIKHHLIQLGEPNVEIWHQDVIGCGAY